MFCRIKKLTLDNSGTWRNDSHSEIRCKKVQLLEWPAEGEGRQAL